MADIIFSPWALRGKGYFKFLKIGKFVVKPPVLTAKGHRVDSSGLVTIPILGTIKFFFGAHKVAIGKQEQALDSASLQMAFTAAACSFEQSKLKGKNPLYMHSISRNGKLKELEIPRELQNKISAVDKLPGTEEQKQKKFSKLLGDIDAHLKSKGTSGLVIMQKRGKGKRTELRIIQLIGNNNAIFGTAGQFIKSLDALAASKGAKRITGRTWIFAKHPKIAKRFSFEPVNRTEQKRHEAYSDIVRVLKNPNAVGELRGINKRRVQAYVGLREYGRRLGKRPHKTSRELGRFIENNASTVLSRPALYERHVV